jgi:myo-inositol-1(or 4)-monophosphatase
MQPMLNTAISAAHQAGDLILRGLDHLEDLTLTEKSKHNYVTEIDQASEEIIIKALRKAYPEHGILAEESGLHAGVGEGDEYQWIIDPLDGTTNFIHGYPHFCVSIALKYRGRIEHGVIYDPRKNDTYCASRGRGAQLNNRRMRISKRTQLDEAMVGAALPMSAAHYRDQYLAAMRHLLENTRSIRIAGAAALDLAYLASGQLDAYWSINLKPWDIAAGMLLVKEAGGMIMDYRGNENVLEDGNIIAGNIKLVKALLQNLKPYLPKELL